MDLPSWARVGAKVVCVDDTFTHPTHGDYARPIKGRTYTIRAVAADYWPGCMCIRLVELQNPVLDWAGGPPGAAVFAEAAFDIVRFRPLVDRQTDIATHFAHHLKQPEKV